MNQKLPDPPDLSRVPSFRLAFEDLDFLRTDRLRPVRFQLELLKPTVVLDEQKVYATVVLFGSARILSPEEARRRLEEVRRQVEADPGSEVARRAVQQAERAVRTSAYYEISREFAKIVSSRAKEEMGSELVIVTGGGPGIMEAGNRGAAEAGGRSIGLSILLPRENGPNPYVSPDLCFQFHYFAIRKMHFLMRALAMVVFPGGFGTMDEMFELLTLSQTGRADRIPIVLCGTEFWSRAINFQFLVDEGVVSAKDLDLFVYADTAEEIWARICEFPGPTQPAIRAT